MNRGNSFKLSRRELLKFGLMSGALTLTGSWGFRPRPAFGLEEPMNACWQSGGTIEVFPTSPLILNPFTDPLPIPTPLAPVALADLYASNSPPGKYNQSSESTIHQIWPDEIKLPDPIYYNIALQVAPHSFTSSLVQPIDANGLPTIPPGSPNSNPRPLPASTIYGFNGTFPGPMINAQYGRPVCVRFHNDLDENSYNLDRQDFGAPDLAFLTHLHNAHTACESDGNPFDRPQAWLPTQWCDNLYLNYPAGGDDREKQSFLWYHDHRMDHTGANVYKGLVGLYPIYDPDKDKDNGDETKGYHLPGVRTNNPDGSFSVAYDIPLAFYDCVLDDGVTQHQDFHNGCGETHPEWWGKTFFRHFPNHGFVGDIFTVNGKAFPVLEVERRRYRLRFLDASIARIYEFKLMSSTGGPVAAPGIQGQYQLPDGQQSMVFTQIATDGGLLPVPIVRDSFQIWPAKRREVIVDFSKYMDGTPTTKGDVLYLVNALQMRKGRKPDSSGEEGYDSNYRVPVLKIVIGDDPPRPDRSIDPLDYTNKVDGKATLRMVVDPKTGLLIPALKMRALPPLPKSFKGVPRREFELSRGEVGGETEWLINSLPFAPTVSLADPRQGAAELWTIRNGGGGWVHPLHLHMEEHQVISRNGVKAPDAAHPDDRSREDVVALEPGEEVVIYRKFRTFRGPYVTHCHNLAHEDHAMMFGWRII